jgi:hypothetical protein
MRIKDCHAVALVWTVCVTQTDREHTGIILTSTIRLRNFNSNSSITCEKCISMGKKLSYTQLDFFYLFILFMNTFQKYFNEIVFEYYSNGLETLSVINRIFTTLNSQLLSVLFSSLCQHAGVYKSGGSTNLFLTSTSDGYELSSS